VGKTSLIEKLIAEFAKHGCRVATIKHSGHEIALDTPGKDSWRLSHAGSDPVVVASDETAFLVQRGRPIEVEAILRLVEDHADIALVEGFKRSSLPKVEVHRRAVSGELITPAEELIAVVSDEALDVAVPRFDFADIPSITDFLVRRFVRTSRDDVQAVVNGKELSLKPFMKLLIARTTLGMMSTMKGAGDIRTLELRIRNTAGKWGTRRESGNPDDQR
jgi:molybdopterin-guanine dinucleotide biosynthesis adapter protein